LSAGGASVLTGDSLHSSGSQHRYETSESRQGWHTCRAATKKAGDTVMKDGVLDIREEMRSVTLVRCVSGAEYAIGSIGLCHTIMAEFEAKYAGQIVTQLTASQLIDHIRRARNADARNWEVTIGNAPQSLTHDNRLFLQFNVQLAMGWLKKTAVGLWRDWWDGVIPS
jgi:hypothetical protein